MQTPSSWVADVIGKLQWPVVVAAAFGLGRAMSNLEHRLAKSEKGLQDLLTRHMPHVHDALTEILARLESIQVMWSRK